MSALYPLYCDPFEVSVSSASWCANEIDSLHLILSRLAAGFTRCLAYEVYIPLQMLLSHYFKRCKENMQIIAWTFLIVIEKTLFFMQFSAQ